MSMSSSLEPMNMLHDQETLHMWVRTLRSRDFLDYSGESKLITQILKSGYLFLIVVRGDVTTEEWTQKCKLLALTMEREDL